MSHNRTTWQRKFYKVLLKKRKDLKNKEMMKGQFT